MLFWGLLIIPSVALFTRTSHYVLEGFRIGICECFGIQGLKMPARAGFSDFHGLGWGGGGGVGLFPSGRLLQLDYYYYYYSC